MRVPFYLHASGYIYSMSNFTRRSWDVYSGAVISLGCKKRHFIGQATGCTLHNAAFQPLTPLKWFFFRSLVHCHKCTLDFTVTFRQLVNCNYIEEHLTCSETRQDKEDTTELKSHNQGGLALLRFEHTSILLLTRNLNHDNQRNQLALIHCGLLVQISHLFKQEVVNTRQASG